MDLGLKGKVALITGGSEGIGKAAARSFAREGAKVVICSRRLDVREQAAHELVTETGGEVAPIPADVSRADDVFRLVEATVSRFGRLDALVNNAGTSRAGPFESATDEVWQEDLELKVYGAIRTIRQALPHFRAVGGGSVVNVLNIGAKQPAARSVPTSVSRAAGLALTKALSKEFAAEQIRFNAVLIGLVRSAQHERRWRSQGSGQLLDAFYAAMAQAGAGVPLGRVADASEAGDLIAFLSSPRSAYITGVAINFDGGQSAVV